MSPSSREPIELPILAQIAKKAGDIIAGMQKEVVAHPEQWETNEDGSVVTPADKESNRIIGNELRRQFKGIPIISEEELAAPGIRSALHSRSPDRLYVDPLDVTGSYIKGGDDYSVNIGHVKKGRPYAGAIYFPGRKELYFTGYDGKAYCQMEDDPPKEIRVKKPIRSPLEIAVGAREQNTKYLDDAHIAHNDISYIGQCRTCMVARGACDLTGLNTGIRSGFRSWDTAGPHAVLIAAGGDIVTENGKPMRYSNDDTRLPPHIAGSIEALKSIGKYFPGEEHARSGPDSGRRR